MPESLRGPDAPFLSPAKRAIYNRAYSAAVRAFLDRRPIHDELVISRHDSGDACDCMECTR